MIPDVKPPSPKQLKNEEALEIYAAFLCGLIILVIVARGLRKICDKTAVPEVSQGLRDDGRKACILVFRQLEKRLAWGWAGQPSCGLILVVAIYVFGNVLLSVTILATHRVNHWASRFGWLGAANMALCVFLGLKNTPLGPVAAVAHTELNILHRIVGYMTALEVFVHAILYTVHFGRQGRWATLIEEGNLQGLGAGIAMIILLVGFLRHRGYEIFYVGHILGFTAAVILTGFHRPVWAKKLPIVMLVTACMWSLDRIIRATRIVCNLVNNHVTFYPLPDGGTRLLLKKPGAEVAFPGSHGFLWIPRIHPYASHPFTVVNNGPTGLELVIAPRGGFTKSVSKFAAQCPGCTQWASIDGPYGSLPDTEVYDRLILLSGGSGAAFTFGLVNRILNKCESSRIQSTHFVWAVKHTKHLTWFQEHLSKLSWVKQDIDVKLYVTREEVGARPGIAVHKGLASDGFQSSTPLLEQTAFTYKTVTEMDHIEKLVNEQAANIKFEKLSARDVIAEAMQGVGKAHRVFLAACGPKSLINAVRESADTYKTGNGYRIDVHCEDFGGC